MGWDTYEDVCNEHAMEFALLKELGQLSPVTDVIEPPRLIIRVTPETRRLVTTAGLNERIDDQLFLGATALVRRRRGHFEESRNAFAYLPLIRVPQLYSSRVAWGSSRPRPAAYMAQGPLGSHSATTSLGPLMTPSVGRDSAEAQSI